MIEKAMRRYPADDPGCQVSVSRNGELIFSKAWGMADLERNRIVMMKMGEGRARGVEFKKIPG